MECAQLKKQSTFLKITFSSRSNYAALVHGLKALAEATFAEGKKGWGWSVATGRPLKSSGYLASSSIMGGKLHSCVNKVY